MRQDNEHPGGKEKKTSLLQNKGYNVRIIDSSMYPLGRGENSTFVIVIGEGNSKPYGRGGEDLNNFLKVEFIVRKCCFVL